MVTTYGNWQTGDVIRVCASIDEFCGAENQFIYAKDINVTKSPEICSIAYGEERGCGLHLNNVEMTFKLVKVSGSVAEKSCAPQQIYKTIGSVRTNSNGVVTLTYPVIEQDRLDYGSSGGSYKVMACITNSDGQATYPTQISVVTDPITINPPGLCQGVLCLEPICLNGKLYEAKCDITTGNCIADATKLVADPCPSNYLDLIGTPWPWYNPNSAVQEIILKLNDINGAIINLFAKYGIIDYMYITTRVFPKGDKVIVRMYLNSTGLSSMGIPLLINAGLILMAIGLIILTIMAIYDFFWGNTDQGFTNGQFDDAGRKFMKDLTDDCIAVTCSDISLTQDQKVACIKDCNISALTRWKEFKDKLFPNADHTPLVTAKSDIQICYDTYNTSGKTATDYQTFKDCAKFKKDAGIDKDGDNTLKEYPPGAGAGATAVLGCWIKSPLGGCLISKNTAKNVAIVGGLSLGAYLLYNAYKPEKSTKIEVVGGK